MPAAFPATFMRGGTSKGIFFRDGVLPSDPATRDAILLAALGSPDPYKRQIDGLGGASSSTSKAVIVGPSRRPDADVDYLFAQVSIDRALVDYSGNCGNLSGAVGPFAISQGLAPAVEGITVVRIWQVNTNRLIIAHVPVRDGEPLEEGTFHLDGVPTPGAEILVDFVDPGGSLTGKLLPTGNVVDELDVPGVGRIRATLLDASVAMVFAHAEDVGLTGTELRQQADADPALLARVEAIRAAGAVAMGLAATPEEATAKRPATPKIAFVSPPRTHDVADGTTITAGDADFVARCFSMGTMHHAFVATGAIALAVAAVVPGTIVNAASPYGDRLAADVRFAHASGVVTIGAAVEQRDGVWHARNVRVSRTARQIMKGEVFVPSAVLAGAATASATRPE
jgi:2-methylaconitate isomerase